MKDDQGSNFRPRKTTENRKQPMNPQTFKAHRPDYLDDEKVEEARKAIALRRKLRRSV